MQDKEEAQHKRPAYGANEDIIWCWQQAEKQMAVSQRQRLDNSPDSKKEETRGNSMETT